jgi:hypothetical protein
VYYDVMEGTQKVIVYGIVAKERSLDWLASFSEEEQR